MQDIKSNLRSFVPIQRNGWVIKLSTYRSNNILLLFYSVYTGQSFVRFYDDEDKAVDYINIVVSKSAEEEWVLE